MVFLAFIWSTCSALFLTSLPIRTWHTCSIFLEFLSIWTLIGSAVSACVAIHLYLREYEWLLVEFLVNLHLGTGGTSWTAHGVVGTGNNCGWSLFTKLVVDHDFQVAGCGFSISVGGWSDHDLGNVGLSVDEAAYPPFNCVGSRWFYCTDLSCQFTVNGIHRWESIIIFGINYTFRIFYFT